MNCGRRAKPWKPACRKAPGATRMYSVFRSTCERLLRIPHDPSPPPGDESTARVFRAAPAYFKYRLVLWGIVTAISGLFGFVFLGGLNFAMAMDRHVPTTARVIVFLISAF